MLARKALKFGLLLLLTSLLFAAVAHAQEPAATAEAAGMTLTTLDPADLDIIAQATGHRLGVQVGEVREGSPAAAAGLKPTTIIFAVGKTGVDTAEKAAAALKAASGIVELACALLVDGQWQAQVIKLNLGAATGAGQPKPPAGQIGGPATADDAGQPADADDPVNAYFNMMDFTRSKAWNRKVETPLEERARVGEVLRVSWDQLGPQAQAQIQQIPQVWEAVRQQWAKSNAQQRTKLVAAWQTALLTPNQFYPPPATLQSYRSPQGEIALEYPSGWVGAIQEIQGIPMLYLGPPGTETTWDKVLDGPNSPPGALLALVQKDAQMNALPSFVAGARLLAQMLMKNGASGFKEINVLDLGQQGAIITYLGNFPGQQEEKFFWVGAVPFGANAIVAGRFGGPSAQAETLVPALHHVLASMKLTPPAPPGGGGTMGAWEAAWSRVDVAITKQIWAPSGN